MSTKDLYRVVEGTVITTFTSSNEAEVYNGETYLPKICGRGAIQNSSSIIKSTVDLKMPLKDPLAVHFMGSSVDTLVRLDIYTKDEDGTVRALFRGRFTTSSPTDTELKMTFNSIFSSQRKVGVRPVFQRSCRHVVYDSGCTLSFDLKKVALVITAVASDGITLTVPGLAAYPSGQFNAGVIQLSDGSFRYVASHVGTTVVLVRSAPIILEEYAAAGHVNINMAPGCNQSTSWCSQVFGNILNHGGFPYIPVDNPTQSAVV